MDERVVAGLSVLVLLAACGSSDEASTPSTTVEVTSPATTVPATTAAPATTAEPTTAPPTTGAPTTTSPERDISFATSGQVVTPMTFEQADLTGFVIHSDAAGDFAGPLTSALVSMDGTNVALVWFEGDVADCGTGGAAIRIATRPDGQLGWEIVPGLGTKDLASLTGNGTEVPPSFTGTVRCDGEADVTAFSSTLLQGPATGVEAQVPAHTPVKATDYSAVPHPAQTGAPRMWASVVEYDQWTSAMVFLGVPFPDTSATPVRNTMVSMLVDDGVCQKPAVTRVFMEDVLYPEFRGAWDVNPSLNPGMSGGGVFDATTNTGGVTCG